LAKGGALFERFTDRSRRVLVYAQDQARDLKDPFIGTEHILLGLILETDGIAAKALGTANVTYDTVLARIKETRSAASDASPGSPPFTQSAKKVLELSLREALQLGHNYIGTEHILLGLLREGEGLGSHIIVGLGVNVGHLRENVTEMMSGPSGQEMSDVPSPERRESSLLRNLARSMGQRLRPDLDAAALEERASSIADELLDRLRQSWIDSGGSR
jgi:ATP-dependent Clp protease ATP-binding subunit ClpC